MHALPKPKEEGEERRLQEIVVKEDYQGTVVPQAATISIFFDRVNYDSTIDTDDIEASWNFFEELGLENDPAAA